MHIEGKTKILFFSLGIPAAAVALEALFVLSLLTLLISIREVGFALSILAAGAFAFTAFAIIGAFLSSWTLINSKGGKNGHQHAT